MAYVSQREAELLPVPYVNVVFTLPSQLHDIAYQNKALICDMLMKASAETTGSIDEGSQLRMPSKPVSGSVA